MARLVLVDTSDALPGLLPLHGWSALMASDVVVLGHADHPFAPYLAAEDVAVEVLDEEAEGLSLAGADLLGGDPALQARAKRVVDRAEAAGEVAYLFGPGDGEAFTHALGMEAATRGLEVEVVYFGLAPKGTRLLELVAVEERLRGPDGCPWDKEQDHASLGRYAVEEVYELLEAIEGGDADEIREELGDVLLQVVFHAQIAEDAGGFDIDAVAGGIAEKLVRRHPHVFGDVEVSGSAEVLANWEELKDTEKPERDGPFDGVPTALPAVQLADKYQRRAAKAGHDWPGEADAAELVRGAVGGVTGDGEDRAAALGDVLFAVVALARRHDLDPEQALRGAAARFRERVEAEGEAG